MLQHKNFLQVMNVTVVVFFCATLFVLTTNAIPLIDAGWLPDMGDHKSPYVKIMRLFVILFFVMFAGLACFYPSPGRSRLLPARFLNSSLDAGFWRLMVVVLAVAYVVLHTAVAWIRHDALETRAFDLGIFSQAVWTTLHGKFLFSSIKGNICLLGDHVSPLLALLAPLYALWSSPKLLLLLQSLASAGCLVLIAILAKEKLADPLSALLLAVAYFFYYPTRAALHEDFHPEVLAEPFLILAFIFLEKKRIKAFLLCLLVAVSAKENFFGIAFMMGIYAAFFKKEKIVGVGLSAFSLAAFLLCVYWIVPYFSGAKYLYSGSYSAIFSGDLVRIVLKFFDPSRWEYVLKIFFPFLFIQFLSLPVFLLCLPVLLQNFISENAVMRSFNFHYTTGLTPFVFIACIYGLKRLKETRNLQIPKLRLIVLLILALNLVRSGPSEYFFFKSSKSKMTEHHALIKSRLELIDPEASVLTHNNLIAQIPNRFSIFQFDYRERPTKAEQAVNYNVDLVIWDETFWEPGSHSPEQTKQELLKAGYVPQFETNGFAIYVKTSAESGF